MGKPNNKGFAYIGFRTTDEVYERVRLAAEAEDRTVSQFMRALLAEKFPQNLQGRTPSKVLLDDSEEASGSEASQPGRAGP